MSIMLNPEQIVNGMNYNPLPPSLSHKVLYAVYANLVLVMLECLILRLKLVGGSLHDEAVSILVSHCGHSFVNSSI